MLRGDIPMDIDHLQKLVGLSVDDAEREELADDLRRLQKSIDQLQSVDVSSVQPAYHPLEIRRGERDDEPKQPLSIEDVLANSADHTLSYVRVPRVLSHHDDESN